MPQLMLYLVVIAALLGLAALAAERLLAGFGLPRRCVWLAALGLSIVLPTVAILLSQAKPPSAAAADAVPVATLSTSSVAASAVPEASSDRSESLAPSLGEGVSEAVGSRPSGWSELDGWLAVFWIASSLMVLLILALMAFGLRRAARGWRREQFGEDELLISDRVGPAVIGLIRPQIVVPEWLLGKSVSMRELVLRHEREHIAQWDQQLLVAAFLLFAIAPWNPVLWWQVRRLRLAIEVDCDSRVVRGGADAIAYSRMLLAIRSRRARVPLATIALTEPVSLLERRIRALLLAPRERRSLGVASAIGAVCLIGVACSVTPPDTGFGRGPESIPLLAAGRQPVTHMRLGDERALILIEASASMLDYTEADVERRSRMRASRKRDAPKWQQSLGIVDALAARIQPGAAFQIMAFNDEAWAVVPGTDGQWLSADDRGAIGRVTRLLREETTPLGESNLYAALTAAAALEPAPEAIYLVTDGFPSAGPVHDGISLRVSLDRLRTAAAAAPPGAAVNVILLPMESDVSVDSDLSASAYWSLALSTGGSLLAPGDNTVAEPILGVSLDSEYLVFIIDTSPSMRRYEWDRVVELVNETLQAHPRIEGLQVLNDQGEFMFASTRDEWLDDTPDQRTRLLQAFENWDAFSVSNPRRGILDAISRYWDPDQQISLYVYSDDFAQGWGTVDALVREVDASNQANSEGQRMVRINAVAFPVYWDATGSFEGSGAADYAALMRALAERNGGSFVALPSRRAD